MPEARTGQITVASAGTAVQGTNIDFQRYVTIYFKADVHNSGTVYVGNDGFGDVTLDNGFPLNVGEATVVRVRNLNEIWFDAQVSGDKICWVRE